MANKRSTSTILLTALIIASPVKAQRFDYCALYGWYAAEDPEGLLREVARNGFDVSDQDCVKRAQEARRLAEKRGTSPSPESARIADHAEVFEGGVAAAIFRAIEAE